MLTIKKRFLTLITILFLSCCSLFAASPRNANELIEAGSWVYDSLTSIATQSGKVEFTDDAPMSVGQIKAVLAKYDYETLNDSQKKEYDALLSYFDELNISFDSGLFSLGIEPFANLDGYYKYNENIDWYYDRYKRQPLISLPAILDVGDYVTLGCKVNFQQNKGFVSHEENYSNFIYDVTQIDVNFPDNGYIATAINLPKDCMINFRIGMGPQSIGRSINGSIIQSEYLTGTSYFNMDLLSPKIKWNFNITQFNVDKYMYTHRFEVRLWDKLQAGVMESILVYAPFELRFVNPFTIYHGMAPWLDYSGDHYEESNTCAYMCFKAAYTPCKYLRLYGLFAQDQFQTAYELKNFPKDCTPNGLGFQLGAESFIPVSEGTLHLWLEGYYADPYLYIKEDPAWSMVRTYRENFGDKAIFYEWIGSPFGPDTIAGELNAEYEVSKKWTVGLNYLFKVSGEYSGTKVFNGTTVTQNGKTYPWGGHVTTSGSAENWVYPDPDEQGKEEAKRRQSLVTPTGTPEYTNRIAVRANYQINDYLDVASQVAYVFVYNQGNSEGNFQQGPEAAVSFKFNITKFYRSLRYGK